MFCNIIQDLTSLYHLEKVDMQFTTIKITTIDIPTKLNIENPYNIPSPTSLRNHNCD